MATLGRDDEVARMIASLAEQTDRRFELIVVDQNDDERLAPRIEQGRQAGLEIQHLRISRRGLSIARNYGLQHARFSLAGFPDDDCWYEPDLVSCLLKALDAKRESDGVIACWVEQWEGTGFDISRGALASDQWRAFRGGPASSISIFLRTRIFEQIEWFDERLGVGSWFASGEETDLILRVLASGAKLSYARELCVHHEFGAIACATSARRRARGTGALYVKHRLSAWVRLRGYLAPALLGLLRPRGVRGLRFGLAQSLGRIEGSIAWSRRS